MRPSIPPRCAGGRRALWIRFGVSERLPPGVGDCQERDPRHCAVTGLTLRGVSTQEPAWAINHGQLRTRARYTNLSKAVRLTLRGAYHTLVSGLIDPAPSAPELALPVADPDGAGSRIAGKLRWDRNTPGRTRTADHLIRNQMLYPAELRACDRFGSGAAAFSTSVKYRQGTPYASPAGSCLSASYAGLFFAALRAAASGSAL